MATKQIPVVQKSLFSWVLTSNLKLQGFLVFIILITVLARVVPLEMQKRVVNEAINLRKVDLLLIYCGIYLIAVIAQGALKLIINYMQARIGQRALAEMRNTLAAGAGVLVVFIAGFGSHSAEWVPLGKRFCGVSGKGPGGV